MIGFPEQSTTVFSAHAEVVPHAENISNPAKGILRARGGSSEKIIPFAASDRYSPRTRR